MIVCPECGTRNEDGELFCGQCGTYLEWGEEGAPVETPVEEPAAEPAAAEPALAEPVPTEPVETPTAGASPLTDAPAGRWGVAAEPAGPEPAGPEVAAPDVAAAEPVRAEPFAAQAGGPDAVGVAGAAAVPDPVVAPVEDGTSDAGLEVPHPRVASHRAEAAGVALADAPPAATSGPTTSRSGPDAPTGATPAAPATAGPAGAGPAAAGPATASPAASTTASAPASAPASASDAATAAAAAVTAGSRAESGTGPSSGAGSGHGGASTPVDRPPVTERLRPAEETAAMVTPSSAPPATRPGDAPARPTTPTPPPQTPDARIAAAAALVAPPPPPPAPRTPAARQPAAVRPGVPKPPPAPKKVAADEPPPAPGDLICGSCGAGNTPNRKFCRRCGASLVDAKVQARRSWWSRLWRPEPKHGPAAGYRPRARRRFPTRPVVSIFMIGALVALVLSFRPEINQARITVLDRIQGNVTVNPTGEIASSEAPGHEADKIRDGATNLAWSPAAPGDGVGQFVDFTFAEPFRLTRLLVTPGASDVEKDYLAGSSPKTLSLVVTTSAGTQQSVDVPLQDKVGLQNTSFGIDDVVAIRMAIAATYRATPDTFVSIAEVEFRGRT